ncbi:UNVERIFIED_CONTAM: hypothetical protein FKN15_051108 [Acipenser sinensis]
MMAASVGAPTTQKMESIEELITRINSNTAAWVEQNEKWRLELGLPAGAYRTGAAAPEVGAGVSERSPAVSYTRGAGAGSRMKGRVLPGARGSGAVAVSGAIDCNQGRGGAVSQARGGEECTSTTAPSCNPRSSSGAGQCGPLPLAPGNSAGLPRPPCTRPGAQESAPLATALPLVPYSALPEHPDVAGLLPDVAGAPPVRCFAPPG